MMKKLIYVALISLGATNAYGQVLYPDDYTEDYYRVLTLQNPDLAPRPLSIHPSVINTYSTDSILDWNIWGENFNLKFHEEGKNSFHILNPRLSYVYNKHYPRGFNDGPVWNGKGSNFSLTAGFAGNIGIVHYTFAPIFWYAQNQDFDIPSIGFDKSEFSYPVENKLDWVMRYGDQSYHEFDWGQSEVRIVYKNVTIGFSTANFSWGPARRNPVIMSKNAGGFPHIDMGTARPIQTKIGSMEFKWYWGAMRESDYFDDDSENDRRYITGFTAGYQPSFIKGLSVGLNRIMYRQWASGDLGTEDFFGAFVRNTHNGLLQNDDYDQMFSLTAEYEFPEVGFRFYLEYARNDFFGSILDLAEHPDRTKAITMGLTKTFDLDNGNLLEFGFENTIISSNQIQFLLPGISATYYVHSVVDNGYTNNGQIVGASIGPGANTGTFWFNIYNPKGKMGIAFQRIRYNDDYMVSAFANTENEPTDFEISLGADYVRMFDKFSIHPKLFWVYRNNFLFVETDADSFYFNLSLSYFINRK